jgi:putative ABC transport system ATP-binding protein
MSYIKVENIAKHYGDGETVVKAVAGMSFQVQAGEFIAVMGKSGSGKSTLLSILGALNTPSTGRLLVDDVDVYALDHDERADFRRESIGFIFQNFNLIPYLTLTENVMVPLAPLKTKRKTKAAMAEEALGRVGLADKAKRLPGQVSGGEQERVAIARAIVNNPPILLADEPTGNLDSRTGREIMALLNRLNKERVTIVMVTHTGEYARYAQRTLHVSDGILSADEAFGQERNYIPLGRNES